MVDITSYSRAALSILLYKAYVRAATACTFNISGCHAELTSDGTTPFTYSSKSTWFTTESPCPLRDTLTTPLTESRGPWVITTPPCTAVPGRVAAGPAVCVIIRERLFRRGRIIICPPTVRRLSMCRPSPREETWIGDRKILVSPDS